MNNVILSKGYSQTRRNHVHVNHLQLDIAMWWVQYLPYATKLEADPHGIRVGWNLIWIALHCIHVGHEVLNNFNVQHGFQMPNVNLLCPHGWNLSLHNIRTGVQHVGLFPSRGGGQLDCHHNHNSCMMATWLLYLIWGDVYVPIPITELQIMKTQYTWLTIGFALWSALLWEKFAELPSC